MATSTRGSAFGWFGLRGAFEGFRHRPRSGSFAGVLDLESQQVIRNFESYKVVPKKELLRGLWLGFWPTVSGSSSFR